MEISKLVGVSLIAMNVSLASICHAQDSNHINLLGEKKDISKRIEDSDLLKKEAEKNYEGKLENTPTNELIEKVKDFVGIGKNTAEFVQKTQLEILEESALQDNVKALNELGYRYLYGVEVEKDFQKSFFYYEKAAELGDDVALNNLGSLYFSGIGVSRDSKKAIEYYKKAADKNNADAQANLGFVFIRGGDVEKDITKSISYFKKAAAQDNTLANFMMGYFYYKGFQVNLDYNKAFMYLKKSAKEGFDEAELVLSDLYLKGFGVAQNYNIASQLLYKSATQGNVEAMYKFAVIVGNGKYVQRNDVLSHMYFNLATVRGYKNAYEDREKVSARMKLQDLLKAQNDASGFKEMPTEITQLARSNYGASIKIYIDDYIKEIMAAQAIK